MSAENVLNRRLIVFAAIFNIILLVNCWIWAIAPPGSLIACIIIGALVVTALFLARDIRIAWPVLLVLLLGCLVALGTPTNAWDARSICLFHAKRIFYENNLYAQLDNYASWSHNDYPVIHPALAATLARTVGHWNEVFPKAVGVFFLIAPLVICLVALRSPILIALFSIGLVQICKEYLLNGYMDAILAIYICAAIFCFMLFRPSEPKSENGCIPMSGMEAAVVAASFLSVIMLLKNEGLVAAICLFFIVVFLQRRYPFKWYALSFAVSLLTFFLTWKIFLLNVHLGNDLMVPGALSRVLDRLSGTESIYLIVLDIYKKSGFWLLIFGCAFFFKNVTWSELKIPVAFVGMYLLVLFSVYMSTPHSLTWHLSSSIERTLMPVKVVILGSILFAFRDVARCSVQPGNAVERQ